MYFACTTKHNVTVFTMCMCMRKLGYYLEYLTKCVALGHISINIIFTNFSAV